MASTPPSNYLPTSVVDSFFPDPPGQPPRAEAKPPAATSAVQTGQGLSSLAREILQQPTASPSPKALPPRRDTGVFIGARPPQGVRGSSSGTPATPPPTSPPRSHPLPHLQHLPETPKGARGFSPGTPATLPPTSPPRRIHPLSHSQVLSEAVKYPDITVDDMESFFNSNPVGMHKDYRLTTNVFVALVGLGKALDKLARDLRKNTAGYDQAKQIFETTLVRFFIKLELRNKTEEVQSPKQQVENNFIEEIKKALPVFFNLFEPINSPTNRKMLIGLAPQTEIIFRQMDQFGELNKELEKSSTTLNPTQQGAKPKAPTFDNLNGYAISKCTEQLFEHYRAAIEILCKEINLIDPATESKGSPRGTPIEVILHLINKHVESMWATLNSNRKVTVAQWLKKLQDLLQRDHPSQIEKIMMKLQNQPVLIDNTSPIDEQTTRGSLQTSLFAREILQQSPPLPSPKAPAIPFTNDYIPPPSPSRQESMVFIGARPTLEARGSSSGTPATPPPTSPPRRIHPLSNSQVISEAARYPDITVDDMERFFRSNPVGMGKDYRPTTNVFVKLVSMGKELDKLAQDPRKNIDGFEDAKKGFETTLIAFLTKLDLQNKIEEVQSPKQQIENNFIEEAKKLLPLFFNLSEPVNSPFNRKMLTTLVREAESIFKQIDQLGEANKQLEKPSAALEPAQPGTKETDSAFEKLSNDYAILTCTCQLFDLYRAAIESHCKEILLIDPATEAKGLARGTITEMILHLISKHNESMEATHNSNRKETVAQWVKRLHDYIRWDHPTQVEKTMVKLTRLALIDNIKLRPHDVSCFAELIEHLSDNLFKTALKNPSDIQRALKVKNSIRCFVDEVEILPQSDSAASRYKMLLATFSRLLGQPTLLDFCAMQIFTSPFEEDSDYGTPYLKLMSDGERDKIKPLFERNYPFTNFEKVWKYFRFSQNILGQGILYYFTYAVLGTRTKKFKTNYKGTTRPNLQSNEQKNEFFIKVKGPCCEIRIVRIDGLIEPDVLLTQSYTILINVEKDSLEVKDLKMTIDCPADLPLKNERLRQTLFDCPLVMESLGFPEPLKINYH